MIVHVGQIENLFIKCANFVDDIFNASANRLVIPLNYGRKSLV